MKGDVVGPHAHDGTAHGEVGDEVEGADLGVVVGVAEAEDEVNVVGDRLYLGGGRRGGLDRRRPAIQAVELIPGRDEVLLDLVLGREGVGLAHPVSEVVEIRPEVGRQQHGEDDQEEDERSAATAERDHVAAQGDSGEPRRHALDRDKRRGRR